MNFLRVKLKSIGVQAAATSFRCMTENAMLAAFRVKNRLKKLARLNGIRRGGCLTEDRLSAVFVTSPPLYKARNSDV